MCKTDKNSRSHFFLSNTALDICILFAVSSRHVLIGSLFPISWKCTSQIEQKSQNNCFIVSKQSCDWIITRLNYGLLLFKENFILLSLSLSLSAELKLHAYVQSSHTGLRSGPAKSHSSLRYLSSHDRLIFSSIASPREYLNTCSCVGATNWPGGK